MLEETHPTDKLQINSLPHNATLQGWHIVDKENSIPKGGGELLYCTIGFDCSWALEEELILVSNDHHHFNPTIFFFLNPREVVNSIRGVSFEFQLLFQDGSRTDSKEQ